MVLPRGRCTLDLGCEMLLFFFFFFFNGWRLWPNTRPLILDPGTFLLRVYLPTQRGGSCLSQQALAQGPAHFCWKFSLKTSSCCHSTSSYLNSVTQHCLLAAAHPQHGWHPKQDIRATSDLARGEAVPCNRVLILSISFRSVFDVLNLLVKLPILITANATEEPGSLLRRRGNAICMGGEGQFPPCVHLCKVSWWPWEKGEESDANATSFSSTTERINKKHWGWKN